MSINYLTLYTPNHSSPVALVEFHKSVGNSKIRNLKWHKDMLDLSQSKNLQTDISHLNLYGYLSKVKNITKLPRTASGNIETQHIPKKITNDELISYLFDRVLNTKML